MEAVTLSIAFFVCSFALFCFAHRLRCLRAIYLEHICGPFSLGQVSFSLSCYSNIFQMYPNTIVLNCFSILLVHRASGFKISFRFGPRDGLSCYALTGVTLSFPLSFRNHIFLLCASHRPVCFHTTLCLLCSYIMDNLRCNRLTCRKVLTEKAVVVSVALLELYCGVNACFFTDYMCDIHSSLLTC